MSVFSLPLAKGEVARSDGGGVNVLRFAHFTLLIVIVCFALFQPALITAQTPEQATYSKAMILKDNVSNPKEVAWNPNGRLIALGEDENGFSKISLWDSFTGKLIAEFVSLAPGGIQDMEWSPDGVFLAIGYDWYYAEVWKIVNESDATIYSQMTHQGLLMSVSWDSTGKKLLTSSGGTSADIEFDDPRTVYIWNIENETKPLLKLSDDAYRAIWMDWSPDGNYLAIATWDAEVQLWETTNLTLLSTLDIAESHEESIQDISWDNSSDFLAVPSCVAFDCNLTVISFVNQTIYKVPNIQSSPINTVAWHPTQNIVASTGFSVTFTKITDEANVILSMDEFDALVLSLSWNPDGTQIVTVDESGAVIIWQIALPE
jgi:WD40 repeat protein